MRCREACKERTQTTSLLLLQMRKRGERKARERRPPNVCVCVQVRASRGLQRTNKELSDGMAHSLLCRLRWSGRPEDQATLAVILLKVRG